MFKKFPKFLETYLLWRNAKVIFYRDLDFRSKFEIDWYQSFTRGNAALRTDRKIK